MLIIVNKNKAIKGSYKEEYTLTYLGMDVLCYY
jgi:hypothetical protein